MFGNAFDSENKGAGIEIDMNASDSEIYSIRNMIKSFKLLQEDPELLKKEAIVLSHIRKVYEDSVKSRTPYYLPDGSKVLTNSVTTIDDIVRKSLNSEQQPTNKPADCIIS
uniref:Uncharacterized protein n=1 Tax=Pithovirus LCPAC201 TaxID=2506591 RepID=A0A481Z5Z4_9VIRU|nr:MAG: hypothetical protein LCPAC201_03270 [Pithovirus LCPAC201]